MKAVNIMNFVRQIDERRENSTENLYQCTKEELELVNEFGFENTFLLQYDALCDERFVKLFKEQTTERTELGIWYEIVEPLTSACGLPYNSSRGWKWDWHIVPGFSMAYSPREREILIDETMRKFKEVFGYYPKSIASWLIDTHTLNYLCDHYDISAVAICRDQTSTDAYTLVGGYFNQAYYPSRNNIFTPAQTREMQTNTPVFRLLGPCPVRNYDNHKYTAEETIQTVFGGRRNQCFTLEPVWVYGSNSDIVDWTFQSYYQNEDLGFSYAQVGQENSFYTMPFLPALRMQLEKIAKLDGVTVQKMCGTGEWFKKTYPNTPATSVVADCDFDKSNDVQSVYYDCKSYMANLFRFENRIFFRALYLFDERIKEHYLTETCTTFDAVYENLPVVDTLFWTPDEKKNCGLQIDADGENFEAKKADDGVLEVVWKSGKVRFEEDRIAVTSPSLRFYFGTPTATIQADGNVLRYEYKGHTYSLTIQNATLHQEQEYMEIIPKDGTCVLIPQKG